MNDTWRQAMVNLIDQMIMYRNVQLEIDNVYTQFCVILTAEMDHYLKYTLSPMSLRKKLKNSNPYWNQQLYDLWFKMSISEKDYSSFKGHRNIREMMRENYKLNRSIFDRELRKAERKYNHEVLQKLEQISTNIHREFWAQMKRLGPRKVTSIPMKVYDVNGNITADIGKVLNMWKLGFEGLLNRPGEVGFENDFHEKCFNDKVNIEWDMENQYFISNPQLNLPISING